MKQKICKDWKGYDKIFHIAVSLAIGLVCAGILSFIPVKPWLASAITFTVVMIVGIYKEVRDKKQKGNHFCVWDLLADCIAAVAAAVVAWLANYYCVWVDQGLIASGLEAALLSPASMALALMTGGV